MTIRSFKDSIPEIDHSAYVDPAAVVIGDVRLGPQVSIWPTAVLRGDIHHIRIGQNSNIQDGSILHVTHDSPYNPGGFPLEIGDSVTIGHQVILHGCQIGNLCLIGMGSAVLDGAIIPDEVMLGAKTLVAPGKQLESGHLYIGQPARAVRKLTDKERQFLRYSALHYTRLAAQHLANLQIKNEMPR